MTARRAGATVLSIPAATIVGLVVLAGVSATASASTVPTAPFIVAADGTAADGTDGTAANGTAADATRTTAVAGYAANLARFTDPATWTARAAFVVPTVRCTAATAAPLFVQVFLGGTDTGGTAVTEVGYVSAFCLGGTASYTLQLAVAGGSGASAPTAAGHAVRVAVSASRAGTTASITDVTTGTALSRTGVGLATLGRFQAGVQAGDGRLAFPAFGPVRFSGVQAAGRELGSLHPTRFRARQGSTVTVDTGPISGGTAFTCTYRTGGG